MMEFPLEIGHMEEIEEHIVETEDPETIVLTPEVTRVARPGGAQKIVYIQTTEGLARAVRVQAPPSVAAGSSSTVRSDGGYIQVARSSPAPQRISVSPAAGNIVVKSGVGKTYMVSNPARATATATPKTITMAQAQQMGLLPRASPSQSAAKLVTLNPTIKHEPSTQARTVAATPITQRVVKVSPSMQSSAGKLRPVTGESSRVVQISPSGSVQGGRIVQSKAATPIVQYVEMVPKEEDVQQTSISVSRGRPSQKATGGQSKQDDAKNVKVSTHTADRLLQLEGSVVIAGNNQAKYVMLPPDYVEQLETKSAMEEEEQDEEQEIVEEEGDIIVQTTSPIPADMMDTTKKRPCNCTKSQCLKLYCECFANGEFCSDCNCKDCCNNLEREEERQAAIYSCLERNPNAFRPKIGKTGKTTDVLRHHKGCHCKRSGCLKNYCECFEARIPCSENCKCVGCKNSGDHCDFVVASKAGVSAVKRAAATADFEMHPKIADDDEPPPKQPYNFMTADVVDATVQCMMAQADECQQNGVSTRNTERLILEEFGRCLAEIIDFSNKNVDE